MALSQTVCHKHDRRHTHPLHAHCTGGELPSNFKCSSHACLHTTLKACPSPSPPAGCIRSELAGARTSVRLLTNQPTRSLVCMYALPVRRAMSLQVHSICSCQALIAAIAKPVLMIASCRRARVAIGRPHDPPPLRHVRRPLATPDDDHTVGVGRCQQLAVKAPADVQYGRGMALGVTRVHLTATAYTIHACGVTRV